MSYTGGWHPPEKKKTKKEQLEEAEKRLVMPMTDIIQMLKKVPAITRARAMWSKEVVK